MKTHKFSFLIWVQPFTWLISHLGQIWSVWKLKSNRVRVETTKWWREMEMKSEKWSIRSIAVGWARDWRVDWRARSRDTEKIFECLQPWRVAPKIESWNSMCSVCQLSNRTAMRRECHMDSNYCCCSCVSFICFHFFCLFAPPCALIGMHKCVRAVRWGTA